MTGKLELVDDSMTLNEEFKKNVAIPYFKDIFKDLVQWSDNKTKGINKVSILTVRIFIIWSRLVPKHNFIHLNFSIRNSQESLVKDFAQS